MALEYSLMLEDIQLSDTMIITELEKMGVKIDEDKMEKSSDGVQITETYDTIGFSLALMDTSDSLFGYESEYLTEKFKNQQDLSFRINKFFDWEPAIINMLTIIFKIMDKVDTNCVFEFNGDTVHLARLNKVSYINNDTGFWNNEKFHYFIKHRECKLLKSVDKY